MNNTKITFNLPVFLTLLFVILQIFGIINWPWYFIIAPILISIVAIFLLTILVALVIFYKLIANVRF